MFSGSAEEYLPLQGSAPRPSKRQAYVAGGSAFLVLLVLFASSGSSSARTNLIAQKVAQQLTVVAPVVAPVVSPIVAPNNFVAPVVAPFSVAAAIAAPAVLAQQVAPLLAVATPIVAPIVAPASAVVPVVAPIVAPAKAVPAVSAAPAVPAVDQSHTVSTFQFDLVYNVFSLAIAAMGSSTVFFFFQFSLVDKEYRTAMVITGLVTFIAFYHYLRIFNSWNEAYIIVNHAVVGTGVPFNDAYRYVDWLLTVPLLLMELILVMGLERGETIHNCTKLGVLSAAMVILGYPGEIADSNGTRWIFWALAMIPFIIIVYTLTVGLRSSVDSQPASVRGLVKTACYITIISWCTYPIVFVFPMVGLTGSSASTAVQVGYSIADIIAKPIMGICCWLIADGKSKLV
jgi:bacteriorhodopsin